MNINENMIKQTNKNLPDSDRGEIRKIKVVRRAGDDDSRGGCHSLEARVGWATKEDLAPPHPKKKATEKNKER